MWRDHQVAVWNAVPCTVVSSAVGQHFESKGGPTYSIDVVYQLPSAATSTPANRYNFFTGSSSGSSGKQDVAMAACPQARDHLLRQPDDPTDAIINRELSPHHVSRTDAAALRRRRRRRIVYLGHRDPGAAPGRAASAVGSRSARLARR
jgi:hypothetical protein